MVQFYYTNIRLHTIYYTNILPVLHTHITYTYYIHILHTHITNLLNTYYKHVMLHKMRTIRSFPVGTYPRRQRLDLSIVNMF